MLKQDMIHFAVAGFEKFFTPRETETTIYVSAARNIHSDVKHDCMVSVSAL